MPSKITPSRSWLGRVFGLSPSRDREGAVRWAVSVFVLGLILPASAATIKLFLKDGSYQLAREYKVASDRVHYFSSERAEWEDLPVELVDLKKTETEIKQHEESVREESKALAEEETAEREAAREISLVPQDPGVYLVNAGQVKVIKVGESKVVNKKGRHILKMVSPIPLIADQSTLELDGAHASNIVTDARPEFYIRLSAEERFGMVRMGDHKGNRVVEKLTIVPISKEIIEEPDLVEIFRKQVGQDVYRIWPTKPLARGEYAVVEYTEGKVNMQVWDFAYQ
ncbi:MAG: hypothetical protein ACR2NN_19670 [Bryobacteraceae bacterium]